MLDTVNIPQKSNSINSVYKWQGSFGCYEHHISHHLNNLQPAY